MSPILRNILAVLAGVLVGSFVNMALIMMSSSVIPLPEGVDPGDMESIKANMPFYQPIQFLMPFLAHALGTLAGAFVTALLAASSHMRLALLIGVVFLVGGIMMVMDLPSPMWFNVLDLTIAYFPTALLGGYLGLQLRRPR